MKDEIFWKITELGNLCKLRASLERIKERMRKNDYRNNYPNNYNFKITWKLSIII
jgi:hypothetical protein